MLNPNQLALVQFVCAAANQAPVKQRVQIYRGMADFLTGREDRALRSSFNVRADILEVAEAECAGLDALLPDGKEGDGQ